MSNVLIENLQTIKDARDSIKTAIENKGATGITDDITTYANLIDNISGGGSGDIKLFETIEEMQEDPNPQEGDLAVVYKEEIQPVTEESEFNNCILSNTIILDEAFTESCSWSFRSNGESYLDLYANLNQNSFRIDCWGDDIRLRVEYISEDGVTYIRTDSGEESIDFGIAIKWEDYGDPFNSIIGKFLKYKNREFNGLYQYTLNYNDSNYLSNKPNNYLEVTCEVGDNISNINIKINKEIDTGSLNKVDINILFNILKNILIDRDMISSSVIISQSSLNIVKVIFCSSEKLLYDITGNFLGIGTNVSTPESYTPREFNCFSINISEGTYEVLEDLTEIKFYRAWDEDTYYYGIPVSLINNLLPIVTYININSTSLSPQKFMEIVCLDKGNTLNSGSNYLEDYKYQYISNKYIIAHSQLSNITSGQLLPNKMVYGSNGIVTGDGSIYSFNNLDSNLVKNMILPDLSYTNNNDPFKWGYINFDSSGLNTTVRKYCHDETSNMLLGSEAPTELSDYRSDCFGAYLGSNPNTKLDIHYGISGGSKNNQCNIGGINPSTLEITKIGEFTDFSTYNNAIYTNLSTALFLDIETNRLYAIYTIYSQYINSNWRLSYMDLSTGIVTTCYNVTGRESNLYYDIIGVDNISNKIYYRTRKYADNKYTSSIISTPLDSYTPSTIVTYESRYLSAWVDKNNICYNIPWIGDDSGLYICPKGTSSFSKISSPITTTEYLLRSIPLDHDLISLIDVGIFDISDNYKKLYNFSSSYYRKDNIPTYTYKEVSSEEIDEEIHEIITYYTNTYVKYKIDYYTKNITKLNTLENYFYIKPEGSSTYNSYFPKSLWFDGYYYKGLFMIPGSNPPLSLFTFVPVKSYPVSDTEHDGVLITTINDKYILLNDYDLKTLNQLSSGGPISQEDYDEAMYYLDILEGRI